MPIIVSNVFSPDHGGIQTMMAALARAASTPHGAIVVAPRFPGYADFDRTVPYRVIRLPDAPQPFFSIALVLGYLKALALSRDRTTLAANWWPTGIPLLLLPRAIRGQFGVFVHGADVMPEAGGLRTNAMRWALRQCDIVFANSSFTRELLAQAGVTKRVVVIPLGVDIAPISPNRSGVPSIISVGRLVERKGFDKVLAAVARLRDVYPDVEYNIIGNGPDRDRLESLSAKLGIADSVRFLGKLTELELREAYARAWCFALPVRRIGSDVEGFGIVYLEAAMARLPTIGGTQSGARDAIEDGVTGHLVDGNDDSAIFEAINSIISDPVRASQMGERGFERALHYTWTRTLETCLSYLRQ